jgi:hypothetical protein
MAWGVARGSAVPFFICRLKMPSIAEILASVAHARDVLGESGALLPMIGHATVVTVGANDANAQLVDGISR